MPRYQLACEDPKARCEQIAKELGHDMVNTKTVHNYNDTHLIVEDGDYRGFSLAEIQSLTPYTPQEEI